MTLLKLADDVCPGCVYYPPNLPPDAYTTRDYRMLQAKSCSFDYLPGDADCRLSRKTSCSLVDLDKPRTLNPTRRHRP